MQTVTKEEYLASLRRSSFILIFNQIKIKSFHKPKLTQSFCPSNAGEAVVSPEVYLNTEE